MFEKEHHSDASKLMEPSVSNAIAPRLVDTPGPAKPASTHWLFELAAAWVSKKANMRPKASCRHSSVSTNSP
jgi:hypothetical protein